MARLRLATVHSCALLGIEAPTVTVEVHIANGLPALTIVGLPEATVRESKDRVRAAIINSGFEFPARRITVNLAPAELPKHGGRFDLPIAMGILCASGQIDETIISNRVFIGELALSGELRNVSGCLPTAISTRDTDMQLVCPPKNATETSIIDGLECKAAHDLLSVCNEQFDLNIAAVDNGTNILHPDMRDVRGQHHAKRALEIAAAGRHNLLMIGPPGTGKSMLASRLPGILPPLDEHQALETASVYSICDKNRSCFNTGWKQRPFRSPHHTASGVALVGGGSPPSPGEISLAHNGILFLDEFTEFDRKVLDVLREPMETGHIDISRAARQARFPARFQLIAAMNPCPQGYNCDGQKLCECTAEQQLRYRSRLSAPLLDRIDIHLDVPRVPLDVLRDDTRPEETSSAIRERVTRAQQIQNERCGSYNADLGAADINEYCQLDRTSTRLLERACEQLQLSARAYHRILKTARSIADLANSEAIDETHLGEAISLRRMQRFHRG